MSARTSESATTTAPNAPAARQAPQTPPGKRRKNAKTSAPKLPPAAIPSSATSPEIAGIEHGMTQKQIMLSRILANPDNRISQAEAFRQVYEPTVDSNSPTLYAMSYDCASNPAVVLLRSAVREEHHRMNSVQWQNREAMRLRIANGLLQIAETAENDRDRIAALKAAGETIMVRLFAKAEPDEASTNAHSAVAELLDSLRLLAKQAQTTESKALASAIDIEAQQPE